MDISKSLEYKNYQELYNYSINNTEKFWDKIASSELDWFEKYSSVSNISNNKFEDSKWFINGKINSCYNCLDRHLETNSEKIAYYWQGDELEHTRSVTYRELYDKVCKFSNVLYKLGIKKGDRVCVYLPLSIEAITAMLACARIGAIHTVVFAGFSAESLANRILDAECNLLITTDRTQRGNKIIDLWSIASESINIVLSNNNILNNVLLVENHYSSQSDIKQSLNSSFCNTINLVNYSDSSQLVDNKCEPEWLDSEDPLFILYTSGSTGKPKGVLHTTAGYLLHSIYSFKKILNINPKDIYWCTADIGWIAGHSYVVYGALGNAMTSVIFSGTPNYPDYDIFWKIIDKYKVSIFYTAPTAIRALMKEGDDYLTNSSRSSLRLLATVGEPINPEAWNWYYTQVGKSKCPIIDTWWQTETGAAMISPLADNEKNNKPGCAMLPFLGIEPAILDNNGLEVIGEGQGNLVIKKPWPGMMRTVYNNLDKFIDTYFKVYDNYFYTGDLVKRDKDGHYWLQGRSDDVLNIAGHRIGTAEIESALVAHEMVSEAAVVPVDDAVKGHLLYAFVTLSSEFKNNISEEYKINLINHVKKVIGPIAIIKDIKFANNLPKTRSGKIMRRILKQIVSGNTSDFGDVSTLVNPEVLEELI